MFSPSPTQGCCSLSSLGAHFSIYVNAWQSNRFTLSDVLQASIICSSLSPHWLCSAAASKEKWGSLCLPLLPTWPNWCSVISTSGTQRSQVGKKRVLNSVERFDPYPLQGILSVLLTQWWHGARTTEQKSHCKPCERILQYNVLTPPLK